MKARKGFEKYLVMLLAIARESNVDLKMHPIDGLMTDVQLQQGLTVINQRLKGLSTLSNDTISLANSEAWQPSKNRPQRKSLFMQHRVKSKQR